MSRWWGVWIVIVLVAAGCYRSTPPPEPPRPERSATHPSDRGATPARARRAPRADSDPELAQTIADFAGFRDAICACSDKPCADQVNKDMEAWAQVMQNGATQPKPSEAAMKELTEIATGLSECMTKLMQQPVHP